MTVDPPEPGELRVGPLSDDQVGRLMAASSDVVLVLDEAGTIRGSLFRTEAVRSALRDPTGWVGRNIADVITVESRAKATSIIEGALAGAYPVPRHLNHPAGQGADVAITYAAVRPKKGGPIIAFGCDMRQLALAQARLVDAQSMMTRDYAQMRAAESRARTMFDMSLAPLLLIDADTLRVVEANEAASAFPPVGRRAVGRTVLELFEPDDRLPVRQYLSDIALSRRGTGPRARLARDSRPEVDLTASLLPDSGADQLVLRLVPEIGAETTREVTTAAILAAFARAPDAIVVASAQGRILAANAGFAAMVQLGSPDQAAGFGLDEWVGQPGVDVAVLLSGLRQHGSVTLFRTTVRGVHGLLTDVEIAAAAWSGESGMLGAFTLRDIGRRPDPPVETAEPAAPRSAEQLTRLIGRVPLRELVRDASDVVERLCIEAALEVTGNNRAAAAEMLGVSRQSLYVKLRRLGLGEPGELDAGTADEDDE